MHFKRVYYPNGKVHYEGYSKSKKFSNQKQIDHLGIFIHHLEGHVRRYDHDGKLIQTLRLKNGVRIPLERVEQRQKSTEYYHAFDTDTCKSFVEYPNFLRITENYSGEIDQYGNECGKGVFFYAYEFSLLDEQNDVEELISVEKKILYVGGFQDGKRCGHGTLYNKDGTLLYNGEWKNDRPHGKGISYHPNGCPFVNGIWKRGTPFSDCLVHDEHHTLIFRGLWKNYDKHGFTFDFKTGEILYDGAFQHGLPHGSGTLVKIIYNQWFGKNKKIVGPEKELYQGTFCSGILSGNCTVVLDHRSCNSPSTEETFTQYKGNFKHGKRNGFGFDLFYNYIGHFENNRREGYGKLFDGECPDITIENYNGSKENDKKVVRFEGIFRNNQPYHGKMYFQNGEIMYEGTLLHDEKRHQETFKDDCSTLYGFYHGFGKSYYPSGKLCYEGHWEYSLQVGEGTFYSEDGLEIRKNEYKDGAWYGYGIYYGNSRDDKVLYNGSLRNGLPHGDGVIFEYDYDLETDVRNIKSVFGGEFFNGKYNDDGLMYNTRHESVFEGKIDKNGDFVDGVQYLNDEFDTTIQWKNGKVFDENEERKHARERLCLSTYLESGNPSLIHQISKSVCKKMYCEMFNIVPKTSKKSSLIRQMKHYRTMQNKSFPVVESTSIDLFGNEIVIPVKGNDGQIYELESMRKLFAINDDHEYTTIRYKYDSNYESTPNFPNTGFANPLSGFYLSPELCQQLSLCLCHKQMNPKTVEFLSACKDGDFKKVKESIENGIDINVRHYSGMTSLMYACENGHLKIVKYLVRKGVDVNAKVNKTKTVHHSVNEIALHKSPEKTPILLEDTTSILCQKICKKGIFYGKYEFQKDREVLSESSALF